MTIRICGDEVMTFDDVLIIKNGKNQRAVENPDGKYPIYGSGGIMGYADDYICEADTVIVGRKGSINNPIFVEEPFWNVDTAFGLVAKREVLLPRYLYYFCRNYDFERLNKAVTIPSLTKSDLLKIEITLPSLEIQEKIVNKLLKIEEVIQARQQQLQKMDELVKARFVELFGDPVLNQHGWRKVALEVNATLLNGRAYKQDELLDSGKYPVLRVGNFFSNRGWYYSDLELDDDKYCDNGDLLYAWSASFGPQIWNGGKVIYHYHIWKVLVGEAYNRQFLCKLLEYATESLMGDTHGIAMMHLTKSGMEKTEFIVPPIERQERFAAFVEQTDKSKVAVQKALDEAQLLFDSLMQKYFG
jgi:type I restriction enzyme S subunit